MRCFLRPLAAVAACAIALAAGCGTPPEQPVEALYSFTGDEAAHDALVFGTLIALRGRVVDEGGLAVVGATVTLVGWGDAAGNDGLSAVTDAAGDFAFASVLRRSVLARVNATGFYVELLPVDLQRPLGQTAVDLGLIALVPPTASRCRFIFAGDTMFGRRYVDYDEDGIEGEPEDLIQPGSRAADAIALLTFMQQVMASADYTQINFESPITDGSPVLHPYKEFKFYSHTETIAALPFAGVDAVSFGNNHTYDALEPGVATTIAGAVNNGLDWFGMGSSETDARANVLRRTINGVDFAMQGFNGIPPLAYPPGTPQPWPPEFLYDALDTPIVKGGSLAMTDVNIADFVSAEAPTRLAIPVLHGGFEYGEYPSGSMRARFITGATSGSELVVSHHPHTLYGIASYDAGTHDTLVLMSLGNLCFDQDVYETFRSYVAVIDVDQNAPGDLTLHRVRLIPFWIEGYVPKLVSADWAQLTARHVGHLSTYLPPAYNPIDPPDGLTGATVFWANNRIAVCTDPAEYTTSDATTPYVLPVSAGSTAPFPYPRTDAAESLAAVQTSLPADVDLGRELMLVGDFEDFDVDDAADEGHLWNQSEHRFVENKVVRSGSSAFVLLRKSTYSSAVSTWMRNRITFPDPATMTLHGYAGGAGSGTFRIVARWYLRDERTVLLTETIHLRPGGTFSWEPFTIELTPPLNSGTVRFYFEQDPPSSGEGRLFLDDLSLILWESTLTGTDVQQPVATPNNWAFIRARPANPADTQVDLTLTHRTFALPASAP